MTPLADELSSVVLDYIDLHDAVRDSVEKEFNIDFKRHRCKVYRHETSPPSYTLAPVKMLSETFDWHKNGLATMDVETIDVKLEPFHGSCGFMFGHNYSDGLSLVQVNGKQYDVMQSVQSEIDNDGAYEKHGLLCEISQHFVNQVWIVSNEALHKQIMSGEVATTFSWHSLSFNLRDLPLKMLRRLGAEAKAELPATSMMRECAQELHPDKADYFKGT